MTYFPYDSRNSSSATFTGIDDNHLIKVVNGQTQQTNLVETSVTNVTSLESYVPTGILSVLAGTLQSEIFSSTKTRMNLISGASTNNGLTITSDGRVGIGIQEPEENLEVDGSIQIDSANVARLKFQHTGQNPHIQGEIDAQTDGTDGGQLEFYTKVDGGQSTEKLRINHAGAIGIAGANYGNSGQVLKSQGDANPPVWANIAEKSYWRIKNTTASPYFPQNGYNREDYLSNTYIDTNETNYTTSSIGYNDGVISILQDGLYDVAFNGSFEGTQEKIVRGNVRIFKTTDGTTPTTSSSLLLQMSKHIGWNSPYEVSLELNISGRDLVYLTQGTKLRVFIQVTMNTNQTNTGYNARLVENSTTFIGIKVE